MRTFDASRATVLKQEAGSDVLLATLLGKSVVIKRSLRRGLGDRLKWMTRASRGHRQWRGAEWLQEHGFGTARPLVLAYEPGRPAREWLVLEALSGKTLLQHIADNDLCVREEHAVARAVGRQVSALIKSGRFNRDHKPSNLIVLRTAEGFSISIIDCVAIRRGKDGAVRMLHALAVEPTGLGVLPRRALLARVVASMVESDFARLDAALPEVRLARWASRRAIRDLVIGSLHRHGDPTPRTNPLAKST